MTPFAWTPILNTALAYLQQFANLSQSEILLQQVFGADIEATPLLMGWRAEEFPSLPTLAIISGAEIAGAGGAYAVSSDTLYLSEELVASGNVNTIVTVFLEEYGHYLDVLLNRLDTQGDEGEYFAQVVLGHLLSKSEISYLQTENDRATVTIDGVEMTIEMSSPVISWTRLLGTISSDYASALAIGNDGAIYIAGGTEGNLDGQTNNGGSDAFISKYNPDGTEVWTRLLGTISSDYASALAIGNDGAIYIAGGAEGNLDGQTNNGGSDAFISKYNSDGTEVLTRPLGTESPDYASALAIGNDGFIYIAGNKEIDSGYARDAFISKYNPDGIEVWTRFRFGDSGSSFPYIHLAYARGLAAGAGGAIYVAGEVYGGVVGVGGSSSIFITKYNSDGTEVWTDGLNSTGGYPDADSATAIVIGSDGSIYMAGYVSGKLDGQTNNGSSDAFISKYNPDGTKAWARLFGTESFDSAKALATGSDGAIYIAGLTQGNLDGQTNNGSSDAFIKRVSTIVNIDNVPVFSNSTDNSGTGTLVFDLSQVPGLVITQVDQAALEQTNALFHNLVGLYEVVNSNGAILDTFDANNNASTTDLLNPGETGYAFTAISNRVNNFFLGLGAEGDEAKNTTATEFGDVLINGGRLYAPFVIANGGSLIPANGTIAEGIHAFLAQNPTNEAATLNNLLIDTVAYFSFGAANPDGGAEHLQNWGSEVFGFEDLPSNLGISDFDFNDAVFRFHFLN
jgi:uncharacterized delta-60 repeat protein